MLKETTKHSKNLFDIQVICKVCWVFYAILVSKSYFIYAPWNQPTSNLISFAYRILIFFSENKLVKHNLTALSSSQCSRQLEASLHSIFICSFSATEHWRWEQLSS